jgi:predicted enzyme related to lactoylglutathione lyase
MPGEMVHFDIPVDDVDKAIDFYGYVMGWKFEKYGDGGAGEMEYWLVSLDPDNKDAVGGGIGKKQMPEQGLLNYYNAEGGLEAFNKRVLDKGGKVMMEKMPVPGFGWMSVCIDPEGNAFGGWVDDKDAK